MMLMHSEKRVFGGRRTVVKIKECGGQERV